VRRFSHPRADLSGALAAPGSGRNSVGAYVSDMLALLDALKAETGGVANTRL